MNTGQKDAAAASDIVTINGVKCKPNWDVQTYLFIGEDDRGVKTRKTESDGTGQSDVLELLVIDTKKNTYHKLPINRDTITDVRSLDDDGSYLATTKTQIALAHAPPLAAAVLTQDLRQSHVRQARTRLHQDAARSIGLSDAALACW